MEEKLKYTNKDLESNFILTIQFCQISDERQDCITTINEGQLDEFDLYAHGHQFANNECLSERDREALEQFCIGYLRQRQKIKFISK